MDEQKNKLITKQGAIFDLVLTAIFFLVFTFFVIPKHVPAYDPFWIYLFSAYTSLVISGVFWIALCFFRVTRVDQAQRKRAAGK